MITAFHIMMLQKTMTLKKLLHNKGLAIFRKRLIFLRNQVDSVYTKLLMCDEYNFPSYIENFKLQKYKSKDSSNTI